MPHFELPFQLSRTNIIDMAYVCRQHRQSCLRTNARKKLLENPLCVGRIGLLAIVFTIIYSKNALAEARRVSPHLQPSYLSQLRGGSSNDGTLKAGGGEPELTDEDLDEYIDFLLAFADDKATEEDNPLFKDVIPEPQENSATIDAVIEPLVDDVDDDTQIDEMVETLVASIDDTEIEGEQFLEEQEDDTGSTIIQEADTTPMTETVEATIESSSDPVVEVEEISREEIATTDSVAEVDVLVDRIEDVDDEYENPDTLVASSSGEEERNEETVQIDASGDEKLDGEAVETDMFYLGSSAVENMPAPVNEEASSVAPEEEIMEEVTQDESASSDESTKRVPILTSFMEKMGLKKEKFELAEPSSTQTEEREVIAPIAPSITAVDESNDATKTTIVSSVKHYYQGAIGSVKDFWSKKPWYSIRGTKPPTRDYNKIYEKYFAANHELSVADNDSAKKKTIILGSTLLKPWGTVAKYLEPNEAVDYSIGIKAFVDEDVNESSVCKEELDAEVEKLSEDSEVKVESAELEIEADVEAGVDDSELIAQGVELEEAEDIEVMADFMEVEVTTREVKDGIEDNIETSKLETDLNEEASENTKIITEEVPVESEMVAEVDSQEVPDNIDDVLVDDKLTDVVEDASVGTGEDTVEDDIEVSLNTQETLLETDQSDDSSLDIPVAVPRRPSVFARLWGTTKAQNTVSVADIESDENEMAPEDTVVQSDYSTSAHEQLSEEASLKPNIFSRLWGTTTAPYSLGLQGINENDDFEIDEQSDMTEPLASEIGREVVDEVDQNDISFSIGVVAKEESLDSLEISDSSRIEDMEEESESAAFEDVLAGRNVLQLHSPEILDLEEEGNLSEDASTLMTNDLSDSEDSVEIDEIHTLQLHSPEIQDLEDEGNLSEDASTLMTNDLSDSEDSIEIDEIHTLQLHQENSLAISDDSEDIDNNEDSSHEVQELYLSQNDSIEEDQSDILDVESTVSDEDEDEIGEFSLSHTSYVVEYPDDLTAESTDSEKDESRELHLASAVVEDIDDLAAESKDSDEDESRELHISSAVLEDIDDLAAESSDSEEDESKELHLSGAIVGNPDELKAEIIDSQEDESNELHLSSAVVEEPDDLAAETVFSENEVEDLMGKQEEDVEEDIDMDTKQYNHVEEDKLVVEEDGVHEDAEGQFMVDAVDDVSSEEWEGLDDIEIDDEHDEEVGIELVEEQVSFEEEEVYVDEIDEDELLSTEVMDSSPYSLEEEIESANFVTRFLVKQGLEQLIMIAIVISEWFRLYVLAPFFESLDWLREGKAQDLLQTVVKTRGGALASTSTDEDAGLKIDEERIEKKEDESSISEDGQDQSDSDLPDSDLTKENEDNDSKQGDSLQSEKNITEAATSSKTTLASPPKVPPNFIFRRLLGYGYFGHVLIMEMILASEWLNVYVPQIHSIVTYIVCDVLKYSKKLDRKPGESDYLYSGAFVNLGDNSRLPKKARKARRKEDQKAFDGLRSIGDVNKARYSYVSQSFMKRHGLGPYNVAVSEIEIDFESSSNSFLSKEDVDTEDEAESDSGWILNALGVEEGDENVPASTPFNTNVGVSVGSGGPKISVGMELKLGKKKEEKSSSLRNVIVGNDNGSSSSRRRKLPKPRVSDSESGIMGRLRAQGANSLVGRSILGAYPGDLPSPDEAADPNGVIEMAQRYGYGDWSDDEDDSADGFSSDDEDEEEDDSFDDFYTDEEEFRPRKRTRGGKNPKKRRSSIGRNHRGVGVGLDLHLGGSTQESVSISNASTRRQRSSASTPNRRKTRRSRLPSPAMEKLGNTSASQLTSSKTKTSGTTDTAQTGKISRKSNTLRPAMSILDETKMAANKSNESQNKDKE